MSRISSSRSSVASSRLAIAAKKAALLVEAECLKERNEMELEELRLKQKRREMEMKHAIAMEQAKENAMSEQGIMDEEIPLMASSNNSYVKDWVAANNTHSSQLDPTAAEFVASDIGKPRMSNAGPSSVDENGNTAILDCILKGQRHQQQLMSIIQLPKAEIPFFDGDPLRYWQFIRTFESCVEIDCVDDHAKFTRLLYYCKGKAQQVLQCCSVLPPKEGYETAKKLLKERFGDEYLISEAWIAKVSDRPNIKASDKEALLEFSDDIKGCVQTLKAINMESEVSNQKTIVKLIDKLPSFLQNRWRHNVYKIRHDAGRMPNISDLALFVEAAAKEINDPVYGNKVEQDANKVRTRRGGQSFVVQWNKEDSSRNQTGVTRDYVTCQLCNGQHPLFKCQQFRNMTVDDRHKVVLNKHLCNNCLKPGHFAFKCPSSLVCTVDGCHRKHNTLLHMSTLQHGAQQSPDTAAKTVSSFAGTGAGFRRTALPVIPVKIWSAQGDRFILTHALLDNGSTNSFCDESLLSELGFVGRKETLMLSTINASNQPSPVAMVSMVVSDIHESKFVTLSSVFAKPNMTIDVDNVATYEDVSRWKHLCDLSMPIIDAKGVKLLIGQDASDIIMPLEVRRGDKGEPYAVRTLLGWTLNGPLVESTGCKRSTSFAVMGLSLEQQLENFWSVDGYDYTIPEESHMSVQDERVLTLWEQTTRHREDKHYETAIPFKSSQLKLPNNRQQATHRLLMLQRKFERDPQLFRKYAAGINDLLEKGHAEMVTETDCVQGRVWYLPHHFVLSQSKPGKIRIVFDCSAKYNGRSLNDIVYQGPDLTNKLCGVLQRFRQEQVTMTADIEAMFHQIGIREVDRDVLRFVWWQNDNMHDRFVIYRLTVLPFGGVWSPSCASYILRKTAEENALYDKLAADCIEKNFYVDDLLKSVDTQQRAIELAKQLRSLVGEGGFKLTKWLSNSERVMESLAECDNVNISLSPGLNIKESANGSERVLGVQWSMADDKFVFVSSLKDKPLTRRGILSTVSSLFDPLGLASPVILLAKKLIQDLTKKKIGWDDALPEPVKTQWLDWISELSDIQHFKVNRCLKPIGCGELQSVQLHHFSDASQIAYGAVSYMRIVDNNGQIYCIILASKSRLAPLRLLTIPRLELCAATLAVSMDLSLRRELQLAIDQSWFWTDSSIVLSYIRNEHSRFQTFVANRLAVIRNGSVPDQWRHVPTDLNPADDVSRGMKTAELINAVRWVHGPAFLSQDQSSWPPDIAPSTVTEDDSEVKKSSTVMQVVGQQPNIIDQLLNKYSSWFRLKTGVAWVLRVKQWLRDKALATRAAEAQQFASMNIAPITVSELKAAEKEILKYVQRREFPQEHKVIGEQPAVLKSSSRLANLSPIMVEGIIRVGGRLKNATIADDCKYPIILPKSHMVVDLIVKSYHELSGHSGTEHVLSLVRQRYWIIEGRRTIKSVAHKCVVCRRQKAVTMEQRMANLPAERVSADKPPFTFTGVDCFGPFMVKQGRSTVKRYGCVFTCLTCRAIHLEVVQSLDTSSFICALHRFMARRGQPEKIFSDNGTNFTGAESELKKSIRAWNQQRIAGFLKQRSVEWQFNPPAASHMGGVWERQIRTIRKILSTMLKGQTLSDEVLSTLLCQVEAIVNSRPLTAVSSDPNDAEPLTPNHLLLLRAPLVGPPGVFVKEDQYARRRWRQVQFLSDVFWKRWSKEYIPLMQIRQKWMFPQRSLQKDDIVILVDDNVPRNLWSLGRVIKVFTGDDGLVRSAEVQTKTSLLVRPITKLCLLDAVN